MFLSGQRPALFLEVYTLDPKTDVFLAISVGLQILIQPLLLLLRNPECAKPRILPCSNLLNVVLVPLKLYTITSGHSMNIQFQSKSFLGKNARCINPQLHAEYLVTPNPCLVGRRLLSNEGPVLLGCPMTFELKGTQRGFKTVNVHGPIHSLKTSKEYEWVPSNREHPAPLKGACSCLF